MKDIEEIEEYVSALFNNPCVDEKIIEKLPVAQSILHAYQAGLMKEDLPIGWIDGEFHLKQTPVQFHVTLIQMAIVLSKKEGFFTHEIHRRCEYGLRDFKNYFLSK